jgi:hypothetical protein
MDFFRVNNSLVKPTWIGLVVLTWDLGVCLLLKVSGPILCGANLGGLI